MSKLAWITAAVLLMPAPALAQIVFSDTPPAAPAKGAKKSDVDKVICRSQDEIGSRVRFTKICMTVHEWQMREKDDRDFTAQAQAGVCVPQAGCNDSVAMDGTGPRAPAAGPH